MPFDLFEISKCPVESLYGVQISLIYHMANSFYSFVANGWNVFGWKMLGEIRKGLKVFGWNEKTPFPKIRTTGYILIQQIDRVSEKASYVEALFFENV